MNVIELKSPYLIFLGEETRIAYAKTGAGLVQWRPELCAGQLSLVEGGIDLGLPAMTVEEAALSGVGSLVVGTAAIGGGIPEIWLPTLLAALRAGLDIVAGVHSPLAEQTALVEAARLSGSRLVDVRVPPLDIPVASGRKRRGLRLLTVGTDCAVGKKYTALAIERALRAADLDADFRASGQTGIMIAGEGLPIDAVVSDFVAGAAELLSPDANAGHWDIIEGQGAITHPGYAAVSLGLLMGSQPDAFVVCHEAGRVRVSGWEDFVVPGVSEIIEKTLAMARGVNPAVQCVGVSLNTSRLPEIERADALAQLREVTGLPCFDPLLAVSPELVARLTAMSEHSREGEV